MASEKQLTRDKVSSNSRCRKFATNHPNRRGQSQVNPMTAIQRARLDPDTLTPAEVLHLQYAMGNQQVDSLLSKTRQYSRTNQAHGKPLRSPNGIPRFPSHPGYNSPIQRQYTHVNVASVGAILDDEGNFLGESQAYHDQVRQELAEQGRSIAERDIRIEMLTRKIAEAWTRQNQETDRLQGLNPNAEVLTVFTAPEWYFKRPHNPFTANDYNVIVDSFRNLSAHYTDMIIVPGTILWAEGGGGIFNPRRKLRNTAPVLLNGAILKIHHKHLNAGDTESYFGATRADAQEPKMKEKIKKITNKANRAYARGRGRQVTEVHPVTGRSGNRVENDSSLFDVGNLKFALEICGDHSSNARAWADQQALGEGAPGAHVHIVVSHGSGFAGGKDVLRPGGIGIGTDASYSPAEGTRPEGGGTRKAFIKGEGTQRDFRATENQITAAALNQLDFGTYPLPD